MYIFRVYFGIRVDNFYIVKVGGYFFNILNVDGSLFSRFMKLWYLYLYVDSKYMLYFWGKDIKG